VQRVSILDPVWRWTPLSASLTLLNASCNSGVTEEERAREVIGPFPVPRSLFPALDCLLISTSLGW
jgi:hypothetical protein